MKPLEGSSTAPRTSVVRSDVVIRRADTERYRFGKSGSLSSAEKKANRKSLEYPQRKIYDACVLDAVVKKSFSFDQRCDGEIVSKLVDDRLGKSTTSARKVQLTYIEDGDKTCAVILGKNHNPTLCSGVSEKPFRKVLRSTLVGIFGGGNRSEKLSAAKSCAAGPPVESGDEVKHSEGDRSKRDTQFVLGVVSERPPGLVSGVRRGVRGARGPRCRSTPPPWGPDRAVPVRICRTWYAGYGPLIEDEDTFIQKKNCPSATVAACGARRRAEGRRRRTPLADPFGRLSASASASSASLNLLPRLSAAVIPLRRKDKESPLSRSAAPLLDRSFSFSFSRSLARSDLARSAAPLLERDGAGSPVPAVHHSPAIRKCETVLALTGLEESEPQRPVNRLRLGSGNQPERVCSRCSSLLSLAASGSRYSLSTVGGFVPVGVPEETALLCKLCLEDVPQPESTTISHCGCVFCTKCMTSYTEYEIMNGAYDISCPDSRCPMQGVMLTSEVEKLINDDLIDKHRKFRLNHEVAMDGGRAFCPRVGCETVCVVSGSTNVGTSSGISSIGNNITPQPVFCPTCALHFCSACTNKWHAGVDCAANMRQIALGTGGASAPGADGLVGLVGDSDLIKWCPMCHVPIEKDEGCAQMMCKRCKHVFCWYCLASLDDDFLLRHYDKGPCKNKLGHSRASVIWHRAQVVGIFAGFGLLLLVASPLLLLAAPCIVCCKCRLCNTNSDKADIEETEGMDLEADYVGGDEIQNTTTPITE